MGEKKLQIKWKKYMESSDNEDKTCNKTCA